MKKPVKITLWTLGGVLAFVVLLVLALPLWIGPVVTSVASAVVPGYTGTDFKIEKFSLNPYSGKLRLQGLKLANPQGYDEPTAVSLDLLSVDLEVKSLLTKKIHIYDITVEKPFVSYVFDGEGSNNFARIAANAAAKSGPKAEEKKEEKPAEETSAEKKDGVKVVIDRLSIDGTVVKYRMLPIPIPIPTLTNIGKDEEDGASVEEVEQTVWNAIKDKFSGVGGLIGGAATSLGEGTTNLLKGVTGAGADGAKAVTDSAKAVTEGATKAVSDGAKAVTEGAAKSLKAVGGLFGGQKK